MAQELPTLEKERENKVWPCEERLMLSGDRDLFGVMSGQKMDPAEGIALKEEEPSLLGSLSDNGASSPSGSDPADHEEEDVEDYKAGGYHPCQIGDTLKDGRYLVIRKLGWGYFSTVWLAQDSHNNDAYVALKVVRAAQNYTETALDEIELLKRISTADESHAGRQYVVTLLDNFLHMGPNGAHVCMVFEVLGENLLSLMKRFNYKGLPPKLVKQIAKQVLLGLDYLHRKCGVIHTDIKPENVLIRIYDVDRVVREVDELQRQREQEEQEERSEKEKARAESATLQRELLERQSKQLLKSYRSVADEVNRNVGITTQEPATKVARPGRTSKTHTATRPPVKKSLVTGSQPLPSPLKRPKSKPRSATGQGGSSLASSMTSQNSGTSGRSAGSNVSVSSASSIPSTTSTEFSPDGKPVEAGPNQGNDEDDDGEGEKLVHGFTALEDERVTVKIADFGNACWIDHHFTNDIQTRQYRAPEILLGNEWGASVDCWSVACMLFELLTGDYLFEPQSSQTYSKDEDHLAQIIELLGRLPSGMIETGRYAQCFFKSDGSLRNIKKLKEWVLFDVFVEKYGYTREEVRELCELLLPLLSTDPDRRADCGSMLAARWLDNTEGLENIGSDRLPHPNGSDIRGWSSEAERDAHGAYAYSEKNVQQTLSEMMQMSRQHDLQQRLTVPARLTTPQLPDPSNLHLSGGNTFI